MHYSGDVAQGRGSDSDRILDADLRTGDGQLLLDNWFITLDYSLSSLLVEVIWYLLGINP